MATIELLLELVKDLKDGSLAPERAWHWLAAAGSFDPQRVRLWEALVPKMRLWTAEELNNDAVHFARVCSFDPAKVALISTSLHRLAAPEAYWEYASLIDTLDHLSFDPGKNDVIKAAIDSQHLRPISRNWWQRLRRCFSFEPAQNQCWQRFMDAKLLGEDFKKSYEAEQKANEERKIAKAKREAEVDKELAALLPVESGNQSTAPFYCARPDVKIAVVQAAHNAKVYDALVKWPGGTGRLRLGEPPLEKAACISMGDDKCISATSSLGGSCINISGNGFDCVLDHDVIIRVDPSGAANKRQQLQMEPYYQFPAKIQAVPNPLTTKETQDQFRALLMTERKFIERFESVFLGGFLEKYEGQVVAKKTLETDLDRLLTNELRLFTPGDEKTATRLGPTDYDRRAWGQLADQQKDLILRLLSIFLVEDRAS